MNQKVAMGLSTTVKHEETAQKTAVLEKPEVVGGDHRDHPQTAQVELAL